MNAAAGMAMGGLRPVVAIYSTFLNRAWDQVYYDVGLHRLPVVFCLDRAGITGDDGPSHHGVLDMMLLTKVPGMTVFAPSSYEEVGNMLHEALAITTGPVAIRWPKSEARSAAAGGSRQSGRERSAPGPGSASSAWANSSPPANRPPLMLAAKGIEATVWDARLVAPLDQAMIADASAHDSWFGRRRDHRGWGRVADRASIRRRLPPVLARPSSTAECRRHTCPMATPPTSSPALAWTVLGISRVVRGHL